MRVPSSLYLLILCFATAYLLIRGVLVTAADILDYLIGVLQGESH